MSPRTFVTRSAALVALAALGLAACESKTVVQPQVFPLEIAVTPTAATLTTAGQKVQFVAVVTGGESGTSHAYTWNSSNTAVATVDANGVATAVANGTASIIATATADATVQAAGLVTVAIVDTTTPPPAPPTISIASITDAGGTLLDYQGLGGQMYVHLNLDVPTGNVITSVNVALDGQTVCSQVFSSTQSDASVASAEQSMITCQVNTTAYDTTTGIATYSNGPHTLSASLVGQADTVKAQTVQSLVFANDPFIAVEVTPEKVGSGPQGLVWNGGAMTVKGTPVLFGTTPLNAVNVQIDGVDTTLTPIAANQPFTVVFSQKKMGSPNGKEGKDDVILHSQTTAGTTGPSGQQHILINLDYMAPSFSTTTFAFASNTSADAAPYWLGSGALLTLKGLLGSSASETDNGVDHDTVTVAVAPAGDTAGNFMTYPTIDSLGQKAAATQIARITTCDSFQNCRTIYSTAFGVDLVPPKLDITAAANNAVNPAVAVTLAATDTGAVGTVVSGIPAGEFKVRGVEYIPAGNKCLDASTNPGTEVAPTAGKCPTVAVGTAGLDNYPTALVATEAYDSLIVTAVDSAANSSAVTTRFYLFDTTAPVINGILPSAPLLVGGTAVSFTTGVSDNIDLNELSGVLTYQNALMVGVGSAALGTFGLPETTSNPSAVLPVASFLTSVQLVGADSVPIAGSSNANFVTLTVTDQAANTTSTTPFDISTSVSNESGFDFAGPDSVKKFSLTQFPNKAAPYAHPVVDTLKAAVVVPTGHNPVFSALNYYEVDAGGVFQLIGTVPVGSGRVDETPTTKTITWSLPVSLGAAGTHTYVVIGVDSNGHGLVTQQVTITVT